MNPHPSLIVLPNLLFVGLMIWVLGLDGASGDTRAAILVVGCLVSIAASALILVWVRRRSG